MSSSPRIVLIAMDGTSHSDEAFEGYMKHIHREDDHVLLVYCAEHGRLVTAPTPMADPSIACRLEREEDEIAEFVSKLKEKLQKAGVNGNVLRVSGNTPGEAIVKTSQENNADMIIVGNHGHGYIRRTLMGSVNDYVLHHSKVPVLVV